MAFNIKKAKNLSLKLPKKKMEDYNQRQLTKGIKVEIEHTNDKEVCAIIAANHLDEFPDYYDRLEKTESEDIIKRIADLID